MTAGMTSNYAASTTRSTPIYFCEPFEYLVETPEHQLTAEELASRASYEAGWADVAGDRIAGPERQWARLSREVRFLALAPGRMPRPDDPGVKPRHLRWIAAQHVDQLNAYQRARVEDLPGWTYPMVRSA